MQTVHAISGRSNHFTRGSDNGIKCVVFCDVELRDGPSPTGTILVTFSMTSGGLSRGKTLRLVFETSLSFCIILSCVFPDIIVSHEQSLGLIGVALFVEITGDRGIEPTRYLTALVLVVV